MKRCNFLKCILSLVWVITSINFAKAEEAICPGGASPRGDVVLCIDFEKLSNCANGDEKKCITDNGFDEIFATEGFGFKIKPGQAAVGNGSIEGTTYPGTTGPGYSRFLLPGGPYNEVTLRYYVKFTKGYLSYPYDHGPGIIGKGSNCTMGGTFEQSSFNYQGYHTNNCRVGSFTIYPNQPNLPVLRNNRWYLIEQQRVIDTHCSNPDSPTGCNGISRVWIDNQLVMEHTNVNWGGVTNNVKWNEIWGPRSYYHIRGPNWLSNIQFDNFVVAKSTQRIGAASGERERGVGDPKSPYYVYQGIEPFYGRHPKVDCSTPGGFMGTNYGERWRSGGSFVDNLVHSGVISDSCTPTLPERALGVSLTNNTDGGGIMWPRFGGNGSRYTFPSQSIHGWVYLPSSNDYSKYPALFGFRGYKCGSAGNCSEEDWGNFIAMTIREGKYSITQRTRISGEEPYYVDSPVSAKFNSWLEFEIIAYEDRRVSLMIDRKWIFLRKELHDAVDWLFSGTVNSGPVVGAINFSGIPPFNLYYDDLSLGSVSFWSCEGWDPSSCPFNDTPPSKAVPYDYDGDGVSDRVVFRRGISTFIVSGSSVGRRNWQVATDSSEKKPILWDMDGDGKIEPAYVTLGRNSLINWVGKSFFTGETISALAGFYNQDLLAFGDYNGSGTEEIGVYGDGFWRLLNEKPNFTRRLRTLWGDSSGVPVPADYDGDGDTDIAVWKAAGDKSYWSVCLSSGGCKDPVTGEIIDQNYFVARNVGKVGDIPIPADMNQDGKADFVSWRPSDGMWQIRYCNPNTTTHNCEHQDEVFLRWGREGDLPIIGDFNGDGVFEVTVYRRSTGYWYHNWGNQTYEPGYTNYSVVRYGSPDLDIVPSNIQLGFWGN